MTKGAKMVIMKGYGNVPVPEGPVPIDLSFLGMAGGGAGIVAAALQFWKNSGITEAQLSERLISIKEEIARGAAIIAKGDEEFKRDLKETVNELRAVVLTVAKLQSSQDVTNAVTARTLESITKKMEAYDHRFSELETTQGLIKEILTLLKKTS
jgi:hypothetical protein